MDIYKDIVGYEGYKISSHGSVISLKNGKVTILKKRYTTGGYVRYALYKNGKINYLLAHRLIANAFLENKEGKCEVNHIDGVRDNNYLFNLEWVTRSENMIHSYKSGRNTKGVEIIRTCLKTGLEKEYKKISLAAKDVGVDDSSISQNLRGKSKTCAGYKWRYKNNKIE